MTSVTACVFGRSRFCNVAEDRDQDPDRDQRHRGEQAIGPTIWPAENDTPAQS